MISILSCEMAFGTGAGTRLTSGFRGFLSPARSVQLGLPTTHASPNPSSFVFVRALSAHHRS